MTKIKSLFFMVALIIAAQAVFIPASNAVESPREAVISYLKGTAKVMKAGTTDWQIARLGMKMSQGDRMATGEDTQVELKMDDGSIVRLGDNTEMVLQALGNGNTPQEKVSSIKVVAGRIWANVAKRLGLISKFEINTPNAIAAVKGTVYRADVTKDNTQVNVYDGTVDFQKTNGGEPEEINAWQKAVALPNTALEKASDFDEQEDEKDGWVRWNKSRDKLRVVIIVPEKVAGDRSVVSLAETVMIKRFMKNYLFQVVDQEQINRLRDDARIKAALATGDNQKAAAAGLEIGSDLVIIGEAKMATNDKIIPNMVSCTARVNGRVIRADTAEVLSSDFKESRKVDITADGAATKSAEIAGTTLADQFVNDIVRKWKKDVQKGSSIDIAVYDVEYPQVNALKTELSKINGLKDIQTLYFVAKRALLTATYVGDTVGLAEEAGKIALPDAKIEVVGLSAYKLELDIKK